ncbi:hypothetical protein [Runella sp.]|uniref:fibronectin type III domain-containing protein n=1 Tax=Runella sp. TaxID=1960881 RepID=UPI003D09978E
MSLSRITAVAIRMMGFGPGPCRLLKTDIGDGGNTHASNTVQLVPGSGSGAGVPITASWVLSSSGGFTHYADFSMPEGYYVNHPFEVRIRDVSSDAFTVYNSGNNAALATVIEVGEQRDILVASGAPAAPSLTAGTVGNTSVPLSWASVSGASGYKLLRSTTSASAGFSQIGTTITGVTDITASGLTPNTDYWFKLVATNGTDDSSASNVVAIHTTGSGSGTQTATPTITPNSDGKVKRQQYEFRGTAEPGAKIQIQAGTNEKFLTATADEEGNWQVNPTQWIPATVTQIRVQAQNTDKTPSNWSDYVLCNNGGNSAGSGDDKWGLPYQKAGLWYGFIVTFSGSPSAPTNVQRGAQISTTGHEDIADALRDLINWFDLH